MLKTELKPQPLGLAGSFGFGDRLGLATPGHLAALRQAGGSIKGIFAQQSIREMTRTNRTADQVMRCAVEALAATEFDDVWGADADHLKTPDDVDVTAEAGFVFFTIDPSGHVDQSADDYDAATLDAKFKQIAPDVPWVDTYRGRTVRIGDGPTIEFDEYTVRKAAVKYGKALDHAIELARYIQRTMKKRGTAYELELSVDETPQPTTYAEHYIVADQLRENGVKLISLAPRFIGDWEKGVDFKGDLEKLEDSLTGHAAIANELGPYKLSLHSGSDKQSAYPILARATQGRFHIKTAGTSYLEALRVVALHEPELFRRIIDFSRDRYTTDKATYHVSATLENTPPPSEVSDDLQLRELYLQNWATTEKTMGFTQPGRQILHCTFGSVLKDPELGGAVAQTLGEHRETYEQVLVEHFVYHLKRLTY